MLLGWCAALGVPPLRLRTPFVRTDARYDAHHCQPTEFTLEDNRAVLQRHHDELRRNEACAVLDLTADSCLGCIYIERWSDEAKLFLSGGPAGSSRA